MDKLPRKTTFTSKQGKKQYKKASLFWNEELKTLWKVKCEKEKIYCACKPKTRSEMQQKSTLRFYFQQAQKQFDKSFKYHERQHRFKEFNNLSESSLNNPNIMWQKLKSLSEPKSIKATFQIIREDGTISSDVKEVLFKWYEDFSECFAGLREDPDLAFDDSFYEQVKKLKNDFEELDSSEQTSCYNTSKMNCDITLPEVSEAINRLPDGKSYLDIPGEALKSLEAKILLQKFFSRCFQLGLSPYDWDKSDIIPIPKPDKDSRLPLNHRPITIMCVIAKL